MKDRLSLQKLMDSELLKMVADTNSSEALETLMLRHEHDIENIAYKFLKRRVLRQDLHQDVWEMVCLCLKEGSYHETGRFPQWLHTLAYRIAKETAEEETYHRHGDEDFEFIIRFIPAPDPADDRKYDLNIMLNILSRGQRKVMMKRLVEQKSVKETAEDLHMTENGVRSVCAKALHRWKRQKSYGL